MRRLERSYLRMVILMKDRFHSQVEEQKERRGVSSAFIAGKYAQYDVHHYISAAKQLGYSDIVIDELKKCKNDIQASNVMKGARYGEYDGCH